MRLKACAFGAEPKGRDGGSRDTLGQQHRSHSQDPSLQGAGVAIVYSIAIAP